MGILSGLVAAIGWGTAGFIAKPATRAIGATSAVQFTQFLGLIIMTVYVVISGELFMRLETVEPHWWLWAVLQASFHTTYVQGHLKGAFLTSVSYNRFVELMPECLIPLCLYLQQNLGNCTGISFVDATPLAVCHNRRIKQHKTFADEAKRGRTSMGWFYGFKLHLVINDRGETLAFFVSAGNMDDRKPTPQLVRDLWRKLFGDKGYISKKMRAQLREQGIEMLTPLRKDMKNKLLTLENKLLQRKRAVIETVIDQLKNISQIEHSRHRSLNNFAVNLIGGLITYSLRPKNHRST